MESDSPVIFYAYNLNLFLKPDGIGKSLPFTVNTHLEENVIDICDGYSLVDEKGYVINTQLLKLSVIQIYFHL